MKTTAKYLFWGILAGTVIGGASQFRAHADPAGFDPQVLAYAVQHANDICHSLDADPTLEGVQNAGLHVVNGSRLTAEQAGQVLGLSARIGCIQHAPLLAQFASNYLTPPQVVIG